MEIEHQFCQTVLIDEKEEEEEEQLNSYEHGGREVTVTYCTQTVNLTSQNTKNHPSYSITHHIHTSHTHLHTSMKNEQ